MKDFYTSVIHGAFITLCKDQENREFCSYGWSRRKEVRFELFSYNNANFSKDLETALPQADLIAVTTTNRSDIDYSCSLSSEYMKRIFEISDFGHCAVFSTSRSCYRKFIRRHIVDDGYRWDFVFTDDRGLMEALLRFIIDSSRALERARGGIRRIRAGEDPAFPEDPGKAVIFSARLDADKRGRVVFDETGHTPFYKEEYTCFSTRENPRRKTRRLRTEKAGGYTRRAEIQSPNGEEQERQD